MMLWEFKNDVLFVESTEDVLKLTIVRFKYRDVIILLGHIPIVFFEYARTICLNLILV